MKITRFISALLTVFMVLSMISGMFVIEISADETQEQTQEQTKEQTEEKDKDSDKDTDKDKDKDKDKGKDKDKETDTGDEEPGDTINYLTKVFASPEEKLATMEKKLESNGYEIWVESYTGEVAFVDQKSGQILFSNPYDVATTKGSAATKQQLLSQVIIKYTDNNTEKYFYSYTEAALRNQIKVKNIKNGVRVEYTIGREETRRLVPRMIEKSRFEEQILAYFEEGSFEYDKMIGFYQLQDINDPSLTDADVKAMENAFPITSKYAVYVFDPNAAEKDLNRIEGYIKERCPHYTYETLDEDHALVNYVGSDKAPALFKLALEYTIDEFGPSVRIPVNGFRFDESAYQLTYISILPYVGAGGNPDTGYTFIPDGSGALFKFEDLNGKNVTVTGKLYGQDYAYHKISGSLQETMQLPVYGVVDNLQRTRDVDVEVVIPDAIDPVTGELVPGKTVIKKEKENYTESRGFLAIIEEGDALAEISTVHGGTLHKYNYVSTVFYPRPKDSYNLADAISVGSNSSWTVVSSRKYVGNYRIRFIMLTDPTIAEEKQITDYYPAGENGWMGMALAYRDYLIKKGMLTPLTDENVKKDIPLYIETFGSTWTTKKFLSIPYETKVALTSFEDIKTMYEELKEKGIENINFKMTGYANGGMETTAAYKLKWEKSVGGNNGFKDLVKYSAENGFGIFPDFDFAYVQKTAMFDGFSMKKDAIKTIDNRYTSKRYYNATRQTYMSYMNLAISPASFDKFYTKLSSKYLKYNTTSISVSTLGTDLNSDFNEDDPYNRDDAEQFTRGIFEKLSNDYKEVMTEGGNSYVLPYIDHLLNAPLDSSRYQNAADTVPFFGVVTHGSINFAGSPINMAGDIDYEFLKAIENGTGLYFVLSRNNTELLKKDNWLSQYYSVRYDIWFDELVERYNELNGLLADLQTKFIVGHEFLIGERVPDEDELEADKEETEKKAAEEAEKAKEEAEKLARQEALAKRKAEEAGIPYVPGTIVEEPEIPDEETDVEETEGTEGEEKSEDEENTEVVTPSEDSYERTKYTSDDDKIVKVTYEGGTSFILNYNSFDITVVDNNITYTIPGFGYVIIK